MWMRRVWGAIGPLVGPLGEPAFDFGEMAMLASLLLVAMPGAPSSFLLLVVRPGAPSSVLATWGPRLNALPTAPRLHPAS